MRNIKAKYMRKFVALLLAGMMLLSCAPLEAFAAEGGEPYSIMLNGKDAGAENDVTVAYGDSAALTLSGYTGTGTPAFLWLPGTTVIDGAETWTNWVAGAPTEPGKYYLGYSFENEEGDTISRLDGSFSYTIIKAALAQPADAHWQSGSTASWSKVTKTAGGADAAVSGYKVALYKDGVSAGTYDVTGADTVFLDLTSEITDKGKGLYTFTVQAVSTDEAHYEPSAVSATSANTAAVLVTAAAGEGVASVTPASAQLLIAGNSDHNSVAVEAVLKSGRTFSGWSVSAADAVTFGEQNALSTTATLKDDCAVTELTITAATSDTTAPAISAYAAGTGGNYGKLTGTASDEGSPVAQYAFSTASSAAGVAAGEWKTVSGSAAGVSAAAEMQVAAAGQYYFYVKDAAGNIAKSENYIQASEVDYSGYYHDGTADAGHKDFVVGAEALTLAVPSRPGFSSNGWHLKPDCSDAAITVVSGHSDSPVTVYTQWTRVEISITAQLQGYSGEYDGAEHALSVTVGSMAGEISYQWYKDGKAIDGATGSSFRVKNVADSGAYSVTVTNTVEGTAQSLSSAEATVVVTKKELTVTAEDKALGYGEAVSDSFYTYKLTGLVSGEDSSVLTAGSLSCAYDPAGSGAGTYAITASGFAAANYDIVCVNGTLTVAKKNGATDAGIVSAFSGSSWTYTGSGIEPEVTVTDGEKTLTKDTDYTVTYSNNVSVGFGIATVTFIGNYTGVKELTFEIVKASFTPSVILSGWTYGETGGTPDLDTNNSGGAVVYYYYAEGGTEAGAVISQPKAAGVYYVYAVVAGTDNYRNVKTAATKFTIAKRVITLAAASRSWNYDGSSYSAPSYSKEGTFAANEGFQSVSVVGSITDVGTVENVISYKLTSATDPANYDITAVNGTLTVTQRALTVPSDCAWDAKTPGTADWVAVTRENLTVSYEYELFRVAKDGSRTSIGTGSTAETSVDLAATIRQDSADNGAAGYCFKVRAVPAGGTNQGNYSAGAYADYSAVLYTAKVTVTGGEGVAAATINGAASAILIQNETAQLAAVPQSGYSFSGSLWSEASGNIVIGDVKAAATTATLSTKMSAAADIGIVASCIDDLPVITAFSAAIYDGNSRVRFTFSATDTKTITGWAITKSGTAEPAEGDWNIVSISALDGQTLDNITETGTYYLWVRDNGGNKVCSSANDSGAAGIEIYRIAFAAGEGGSGSMSSILKVENIAVTLPLCAFTRSGYSFRNWQGASGIYTNGGAYEANKNDALVVQWTDEQFVYTINYYLMDTAGSYPEQPSQTSQFSGAYGAVIASASPVVALSLKGMELDTAADKTSAITLTADGLTLSVYYKRLQYTATYSYTPPAGSAVTSGDTYYYGAAFTEKEKPAADGYAFVGWIYDGSSKAPATMPNNNVTATGTFVPANANYLIHCYEQNLKADGSGNTSYTLVASLDRNIGALQGDTVNFALSDAVRIDGFTAAYVTVSSGAAGGSTPSGTETTASGTVSSQESAILNVNFYYTRNTYRLTLNVYDSNLRTNAIYTHTEDRLYGAAIDAEAFANYGKANWTGAPAGSMLASYADWSTGAAPAVMPAGDVSVARDYVKSIEAPYGVEVYCENADGTYSLQSTLAYYGFVGADVTIGGTDESSVNYTKFTGSVANFAYYEFDSGNKGNVTSGTVSSDGRMLLKVYFQRKSFKTTITYYYNDGTQTSNVKLATVVKTGKWGTEYTCQPLALFDGSVPAAWDNNGVYTAAGSSIVPPYDFKTNSYMADYVAYYWDEYNHWQSCKYTTVASLTDRANDKYIFGKNDNGYVAVYYIKANREIRYTLDVMYNPRNLIKSGDSSNHPLTVTVNGSTYNVRVANKADIFTSTWTPSDGDYTAYPALETLSGSYTYDGLKSGFSEVTVNGATYYLNSAEPGYLYAADAENQFYFGNRVGYNFLSDELNTGKVGYDTVENYLTDYKATHGDSANAGTYDDKRSGAYIYNGGYSSIMYGNGAYVFTFDYAATYSVSYTMNGNTHTDTGYVYDQTVNVGCSDTGAFPVKSGYTVRWYTDTSYTTLAADFNIRANTVFYGRYVRSTVEYTVTNYYQLPDTGAFVTDTAAAGLTSRTGSETVTFTDGAGVESSYNVTVTKYYLGDSLVIAVRKLPCLAYSEVSLDYDKYLIDGLVYDGANSQNVTKGYCEAAGIALVSYYKRVESVLTVNAKTMDVETVTKAVYRAGQSVTLPAQEKEGYTFAGWSIQYEEGGVPTDWTGTQTIGTDKSATFAMPTYDLCATAQWTPASYTYTLVHYFETTGHTYDADLYARLAVMTGTDATIAIAGTDFAGKVYSVDGSVVGVSAVKDGRTYYFSAAAEDGGVYTVDAADLIAVSEPVTAVSERVLTVADKVLVLTGYPYTFSFAEYRKNAASSTLAGTGTYTHGPGMSIGYYYTRASGYRVTVAAAANDGGDAGLTLTGGGADFSYGETATVRAAVAAGYTFAGWYLASDTGHETPVSTSEAYSFRVKENVSLVALSRPAAAAEPTVAISGQTSYIYGYGAARTNAITAAVTFGEGTDSANKVVSYQWYAVDGENATAIDGAVSSTYIFPAGKSHGSYSYRCDVVVTRSDTGRSATVRSNILTVTVSSAVVSADVAGYDGTYDGAGHGITVTAKKPTAGNTIYYSETELTAENYRTAGSATNPLYTNVRMTDGAVGSYTVYYYIHNDSADYSDASGSAQVKIEPIQVSLKASGSYHKMYDGTAAVSGAVTSPGTGKYILSHGTSYTIIGLLEGDAGLYIADFDAAFNSKNVSSAGSVTLSSVKIVSAATGEVNYNYSFASGYTIVISGYINPYVLVTNWGSERSFVYDGTEKKPSVSLASSGVPEPAIANSVIVQGGQINAGTYTAYAAITPGEGYMLSNYTFSNASCGYEITKRGITIAPVVPEAGSVVYSGAGQKVTGFTIGGAGLAVVGGTAQTYTAEADKGAADAGTTVITAKNMHIYQGNADVTDNYDITYLSSDFVIAKKAVTVSGFRAVNKVYDGTDTAAVTTNGLVFTGLEAGDSLSIPAEKVTAAFESAGVGTDKTVTVTLEQGDLSGTSAANYTLDVAGSTLICTADITPAVITVTGDAKETVYGKTVAFTSAYTGFVNSETESVISGSVGFSVKSGTGAAAPYTTATPAGTYDIILDVSGLSADNYTFKAAATPAKLTVAQRPLAVTPSQAPSITKTYDGTTKAAVDGGDWVFAAVVGNADSGIVNGDSVTLTFSAAYDSKDVSDNRTVTMSGLTINSANYVLSANTCGITTGCSITRAPLTITAADKTAAYGSAAPAFTANFNGFVGGEGASALGGTLTFACGYDTGGAAKRGVGSYTITPSGSISDNYDISFKSGTLTVSKAVITVTASPASLTYGVESSVPAYTSAYSGFQYTDNESVINGTLTTACSRTYSDMPGEYAGEITPVITGLTADNYTFKAVAAKLTIVRHEIKVTGITVDSKTYDGTTAVSAAQIKTADAVYGGILDGDVSNKGVTVTGVYDSKNVGTGIRVGLTVGLNSYLAARYILSTDTQSETTAAITQKALTVKADNKSIKYGDAEPAYGVTYDGFVSGEGEGVLTGTLAFTESYTADAAGTTYSPAGTYTVSASGYERSGNYAISYTDGTLTVAQAQLSAPAVSWSAATSGTVDWTEVSGIGAVAVGGYTISLYKAGEANPVKTVTAGAALRNYSFLEDMRGHGAGEYKVQVVALASVGNNADQANVADSAAGASGSEYAAKVNVAFASDTISQAAAATMTGDDKAISINAAATSAYVMIAGETGAAITAHLKNVTGYSVKSLTSSSTALTLVSPATNGTTVSSTAALSASLASAADINVTLALTATPATVTLAISGKPEAADFGYTAEKAPQLTATVGPESGDNLEKAGYTYTYKWYLKEGAGANTAMESGTGAVLAFPTGKSAASDKYHVTCEVTATRSDNGQSKTITSVSQLSAKTYFNVVIRRAEFSSVVSLAGWTYGEARKAPSVSSNPGEGTVRYEYNTAAGAQSGWTTSIPKDAGTYYVRAYIPQTLNYSEFQTQPVAFMIAKAKLAAPDGLTMAASATAPYGQVSWSAVSGPKENAGTSADSTVSVKYEVKLYRAATDSSTDSDWTLVYTSDTVTATSLDLTQQFTQAGFYRFTVEALATCSNGKVNCDDSDESARGGVIEIKSTMGSGDTTYEYKKVYDGNPIVLNAADSLAGVTYQWLRDKTEIAGATGKTLDVTFVGETGTYTCRLTVGSDSYYSSNHVVTITPLPVTVTSDTQTKVYDGTPLVGVTKSVTTLGTGDAIAYTLASRTDVGTSTNTITGVTITHNGTTTVFAESGTNNNYTLTKTAGTLTVTARSLADGAAYNTGIAVRQPDAVTYDGTAHTPAVTVTDSTIQVNGADKVLALNTDYTVAYSANKDAGTAVVTITGKGNYSGAITRSFTINKREVTLTSASQTREYNGAALTNSAVTVTTGSFASGEGATYSATGSQLDVGESDNTFTYALNANTKAADYTITTVAGKLTVTKNTSPVVVIAGSGSKTYDGTALTKNSFTHTGTIASIDKLTAVITGTQTDAGESANVVTSCKVIRTSDNKDVTGYYTFGDSVPGKLTVSTCPVTLTSATDAKVYDGTALTNGNVTVSGSGWASGEGAIYTVTGSQLDKGTSDNAFSYTLNSNTKANNYSITKTEGKLTVTAKPVTITVSNASKVYSTADPTFTGTISGLVAENDLGTVTYSRTGSDANVGTYAGVLTASYTENANYTVTVNKADFTITRSGTLTVTGTDYTGIYDGEAHGDAATSNVPVGTTITYSVNDGTYSAAVPTITNVGTVNVKVKAENPNYVTATGSYTLTVAKRAATITVDNKSKTYGTADPAFTGTVRGLVKDTDLGTVTYSRTNSTVNNVGTYTGVLTVRYTANGNYDVNVVNGDFTIDRASTLTVTGTGCNAKYDGAPHGAAATANVTEGTTVSYSTDGGTSWSKSVPTITDVGTRAVQIKAENANYETAKGSCTLTVTKRAVTLTSQTDSKTYNGTALTNGTVTVGGDKFVNGEGATYDVTGSQLDPGESNNSFTYALNSGTKAGNYDISTTVGKLTVSKITTPIVVTANSKSKIYDGTALTDSGFSYTQNVLANGDTLTADVEGSQTDVGTGTNAVKSYQVKRGETDVTNNYTFGTSLNGTLTVTPATLAVTSSGYTGTYDGAAHGVTVNAPAGATVKYRTAASGTYGLTENPTYTDAGTYTVYYEVTKANYTTYTGSAVVSIAKAQLTATYAGESVVYGTSPVLAVAVTDFVNGETAQNARNYTAPTLANSSTNAGTYTLTPTGGSADNYSFQYVAGTLTITKKPVTAVWESTTAVYTGKPQSASVSLTETIAGLGVSVTTATDAGSSILTASLTGADKANYTLTNPSASFLIQRAPVTFTVTNNSAEYNGKAHAATISAASGGDAFSSYTITYKNGKGETVAPTEVGSYDIYAAITNQNFRHAGTTDGSPLKIGVLTVYAKAASAPTLYTVSFAGGDGATGSVDALAGAQAETIRVLPANGFTKTDYSFTGWLYNGGVYQPGERFTQPAANVTMTAQWTKNAYNLGGVVDASGEKVANAVVTLTLGSNLIAQTTTDTNGRYSFAGVLPGTYNLAASYDGTVETIKQVIESSSVTDANITLPAGKTNSVVVVKAGTPDIVVGNLEQTFKQKESDDVYSDNDKQTVVSGGSVEIKLTAAENPNGSDEIETQVTKDNASAVVGIYIDLDLSKTVTTVTTSGGTTTSTTGQPIPLSESNVLLETIIPLTGDLQGKSSYSVYREHMDPGETVTSVTAIPQGESSKNSDGEYFTVNEAKTVITVHAKKYSTYAIAYTEASPSAGGSMNSITVSGPDGGSAAADQTSAAAGSKVTVTVTAAEGYRLESIRAVGADGSDVALTENTNGSYSFTMPGSAVTVTPVFVKKPWAPDKTGVSNLLKTADHIRYINGYPDGSVGPERNMTRAEAAQMFYNLLLDQSSAAAAAFSDVPDTMWCAKAVNTLSALGIIDGYGDGRFGPNDPITREQFCAMAVRFTSVANLKYGDGFPDVAAGRWSYGSVMTAAALGWISGFPDGTFRPDTPIYRAEVVTIVNHMLGRSADRTYVNAHTEKLQAFSDLTDSGKWYYYDMTEAANAHGYAVTSAGNETWTDVTAPAGK